MTSHPLMKAPLRQSTAAGDDIGSDGEIKAVVVEETDRDREASVDREIVGAGEGILAAAAAVVVVAVAVMIAALRRHQKAVVLLLHLGLIGVLLRKIERKWIYLKQFRRKRAIVGKILI